MFNDHLIFSNNFYDAAAKLRQIQEANVRSPEDSAELARRNFEAKKQEFVKTHGRSPEMEELDAMMGGRHKSSEAFRRGMVQSATSMLGDIAQAGDAETVRQIGQVLHGMSSVRDPSLKVAHASNAQPQIPVAAYRKMIQIGKGRYQIPWQEEQMDMSPDVSDGPDADTKGSTDEVISAQRDNQLGGTIRPLMDTRTQAIRQMPMTSGMGMSPSDVAAERFRQSTQRRF